ncbi:MAG TPA: hypothetical protein VHQ24_07625 [Lachnospiraceae bacterium]|nr:hypothetical protein [Lachnospiraceae bacterium]
MHNINLYLLQICLIVCYILLFILFIRCVSRKAPSQTSLRRYHIITIAVATIFVVSLELFLQSQWNADNSSLNMYSQATYTFHQQNGKKDNTITFLSDIDHDGIKETLVIDMSLIPTEQTASLSVINENGETIWSDIAGLPHAGWNSYYLYTKNGKDYLFQYNPSMYQGNANYTYDLFYLDALGNRLSIDSGQIAFSINPGSKDIYDAKELATFAKEVDSYLTDSFLLLSSEDGVLSYSTPEHVVTRKVVFQWLGTSTEVDSNESLLDRLEDFKEKLQGED